MKDQPRLRVVNRDGSFLDVSSNLLAALNRHVVKPELPFRKDFDLPSPALWDFSIPHRHRLATHTECVPQGLMSAAEVIDNLLEGGHGLHEDKSEPAASVSVLPLSVKSLTNKRSARRSKLAYMGKKRVAKDPWAIARGKAMATARHRLGMSQAKVAELAGVNDRETISQYEHGVIEDIDMSIIPKLARVLGMPAQELSRTQWEGRDEAADLKVSNVARQLAYNFDHYPLIVQNQIREAVAQYQNLVKKHGKEAADALFSPAQTHPSAPMAEPKDRRIASR